MKKKIRVIGLLLGAFLVLAGSFLLKQYAFQTSPIKNNMLLEEIQKLPIKIEYVVTSEDWNEDLYASYCQEQIDGAKKCNCIFKVEPTGNIYVNRGVILQEVLVKKVIRGECQYDRIWIKNGLKSSFIYRGKDVLLTGRDCAFLQEDCEYLFFGEPAIVNPYSKKKVYEETEEMWFGCYNLTRDNDTLVEENEPDYDPKIEFYTSNIKIMECYCKAKKELIKIYNKG